MPNLNPSTTALLVIDVQVDYCSPEGFLARYHNYSMQHTEQMLTTLQPFISKIRETGIKVIFLRAIENPDYILPNHADKINSFEDPQALCTPGTKGFKYYKVEPKEGDIEIIKNSYDAFITDSSFQILNNKGIQTALLQETLNAHNINTLIFTGVLTSRCVDSTLRSAFRLGYNCIVAEDLVSTPDQLLYEHTASLSVWSTIFAEVVSSDEIIGN